MKKKAMNVKDLQVGERIGIRTGNIHPDVEMAVVEKITPSGQIIAGGKRFNPDGYLRGDSDSFRRTKLCSVEEAEGIMSEKVERDRELREKRERQARSPRGIGKEAAERAMVLLNERGYYPDVDGHWSALECEIASLIADYLKTQTPVL